MTYLTEEQAQQIEEVLSGMLHGTDWNNGTHAKIYRPKFPEALAIIRAARAQEPITTPDVCGEVCARAKLCYGCGKALDEANAKLSEQADHIADADKMVREQVLNYERLNALREGEQNKAEDDYFNARPENDTPTLRKMFCQGFERGFHKWIKYSASVEPVKQEPVALLQSSKANFERQFGKQVFADWIYSDLTYSFENAAPQPVQEPVAVVDEIGLCVDGRAIFYAVGKVKVGQKLYAAPVRTKDLTEQEIQDAIINISPTGTGYFLRIARAVIAADRELNRA